MSTVNSEQDRRSLAALLEHHSGGAWYYLPSFEVDAEDDYRCSCPIVILLPMSYYYPVHGTPFDAPKPTKEATMLVSLVLFLIEVAQESHATVVIEQVVDERIWNVCESGVKASALEKNVLKAIATKYLRFHILFTEESAGLAGDIMTARLAPVIAEGRPTKRARSASFNPADAGPLIGDFTVSAQRINSEDALYKALMDYHMGLADVRRKGEMTYSLSSSHAPSVPSSSNNRFDDDSADEGDETSVALDDDDGDYADASQAACDNKYPPSHVFHTLSLYAVAASYQHELMEQSCHASTEQANLAGYFADGVWQPGSTGDARRRRLFTVLDFRTRGAAWWNSSFSLPQWPAPLQIVIQRLMDDHRRRGLQTPNIENLTFEELSLMHRAGPNGEPREMQAHGTFHPIQVSEEAKVSVSSASSHGEQVLSDVFKQFSAYKGVVSCLRRVGSRNQNTFLWADMVINAVDNIYAECPDDDECGTPACYSQARRAYNGAIQEMSDGVSAIARTTDSAVFHVEKKVGISKSCARYDDFLYSTVIAYNKHGLKQTQRQSDTWLPLFMSACSLGYHKLGAQIVIYLAGDIDIGKSTLMKMVMDSLPRSLTVDMGTSTEASLRTTNCGRLSTVDDVGGKQAAQEHQQRTQLSNGYLGECKKVRDSDGNWVFKAFQHLRMLGHIWCGNVLQSSAIISRSISIMTLGEKTGGSAPAAPNKSKFDMSVAPQDKLKKSAALVRNKVLITGTYHLYLLEAIGAVEFNDTMMPVIIALARKQLGLEFTLSSRLVEHAYKFAISFMVLFLSSMWNTFILPTGYTRTERVELADGKRIARKVTSPRARHDEVLFYAANAVLSPMHCARVIMMLKRTSNNKSLHDKVDIALKMLIEFEEGGTMWQTDPNSPDMVVLKITKASQQSREVKELVPWCPGMGDEYGMLASFYDQMLQKRMGEDIVMGIGTGKFKNNRTINKEYILQRAIRGPFEDKIWRTLLWVMDNRDDLWTVSFDETAIIFRGPVAEIIAKPASPSERTWAPDGHSVTPPDLANEKNPDRPGAGPLDRALWMMSLRRNVSIYDTAKGGKVFRPSSTAHMLDVWDPCSPDGNAIELKGGNEPGCYKMPVDIYNAIEIPYTDLLDMRETIATSENPVRCFTAADEALLDAAIALEGSGIKTGDRVVIGTQPVCPEGGQCYTTHTHRTPTSLPVLVNPNHIGASVEKVPEYGFGDVIEANEYSDDNAGGGLAFDDVDCSKTFADQFMPPCEATFKPYAGMFQDVVKSHQRRTIGFNVPRHLDAYACNLPRVEYTIIVNSNVYPLFVVQGAGLATAVELLFDQSVSRMVLVLDTSTEVDLDSATTAEFAAGTEFEVEFLPT